MAEPLQYVPFSSALDPGFWHVLSKQKLDIFGLDDQPKQIHGFYSNSNAPGLPSHLNLDFNAFESVEKTPPRSFPAIGTLKLTNTIEDFKLCDKKQLLENEAMKIWDDIKSGHAIEEPALLARVLLLTYADLKKYHYYYWFAFPALCSPEAFILKEPPKYIEMRFSQEQIKTIIDAYERKIVTIKKGFFILLETEDSITIHELTDFSNLHQRGKVIFCVCDPSTLEQHPGWPLRNFLMLASYHWSKLIDEIEVLCLRDFTKDGKRDVSHSLVLTTQLPSISELKDCPKSVGWEKNERQKLGPRHVNLSASMDPKRIAESAVDLNLKLMRWRLLPDLDLDKIAQTRCLLFGAGTLGCNVARCLLGWGVRNISLVDNSSVSYSNPVRQSLFTFDDSLKNGKPKAEAAALALKKIFPGVNSSGYQLSIPMPGHSIPESAINKTLEDLEMIESLVDQHDVIFLLMDTRESRWLPTLLGAAKQKLVMNAALGFDTYLIVRHGLKLAPESTPMETSTTDFKAPIAGHDLGCYFCNDVVAPGDSTRDRTLDQQCTVSRPGMSMLASALVVELMISVLQHPQGGHAPADLCNDDALVQEATSSLGLVPHQLRGFLSRFSQVMPASRAFDKCTACSEQVISRYRKDGKDFLLNVFNKPSNYLEDLTGLTALHSDTNLDEVWELSDDDDLAM